MGTAPDYTWMYNILSATCASVLTWLLTRKKQNAEVESNELDNVVKAINIWKDAAKDMTDMVRDLRKEVDDQAAQIKELKIENEQLREEIRQLKHP